MFTAGGLNVFFDKMRQLAASPDAGPQDSNNVFEETGTVVPGRLESEP